MVSSVAERDEEGDRRYRGADRAVPWRDQRSQVQVEGKEKKAPARSRRLSAREVSPAFRFTLTPPHRVGGRLIANGREQFHEGPEQ